MKKSILVLLVLFTAFLSSCHIVSVSENVEFPAEKFEAVKAHIAKLKRNDDNPHKLRLLVYDGESRELVKINVPMWMADLGFSMTDDNITKIEIEGNTCDIEDLVKNLPSGLLAEVEDYEENSHVLIWIE